MEYKPSFSDSLRADIQPSYNDSLQHHGVLGMHWGVRRYQNKDGSLTAAGKKHYSWNPIKRYQEAKAEKQRQRDEAIMKAAQKREQNMKDQSTWDDICDTASYYDSKYEKPFNKAVDDYDNAWEKYGRDDPRTKEAYDKASKLAYDHGYDTGKKAAKEFRKNYDDETLNRVIDKSLEEYYSRKEISAMPKDPVEKFARWNGTYEQYNM